MNIKQQPEYPSQILILNIAGSVGGSIVLVVFMIAACVVCRRNGSKNGDEERNGDGPSITASTSVQHENEYQIPVVTTRTSEGQGALQGASSNVYTVPNQANIVYTDLDKHALNSSVAGGTKPMTSAPTEYAIIDHKRDTAGGVKPMATTPTEYAAIDHKQATTNQNEERHYANISNKTTMQESNVYANLNNT